MTKVELFNAALSTLGQELLSKETDKGRNGDYCRSFYPTASKVVLSNFDWNCVRRRVALTALLKTDPQYNADITNFEYQYALPADYLNIVSVGENDETPRLVENGYLYCNVEDPTLIYTSSTIEPVVQGGDLPFTDLLCNSISLYMAYRLAVSIDKTINSQLIYQEYNMSLLAARNRDGGEKSEESLGEWID